MSAPVTRNSYVQELIAALQSAPVGIVCITVIRVPSTGQSMVLHYSEIQTDDPQGTLLGTLEAGKNCVINEDGDDEWGAGSDEEPDDLGAPVLDRKPRH